MPAYVIGQVTIHDPAEYEKYIAGFMDAFAPFDGPDGYRLRWILSIPEPPLNRVLPFLIKDETPRDERVPRKRAHRNGITGILSLTLAVEDPGAISVPYTRVLGHSPESVQRPELDGSGVRFTIGPHAVELIAPQRVEGPLVDWIGSHGQSPYAATLAGPASVCLDSALLWGARLAIG